MPWLGWPHPRREAGLILDPTPHPIKENDLQCMQEVSCDRGHTNAHKSMEEFSSSRAAQARGCSQFLSGVSQNQHAPVELKSTKPAGLKTAGT